MSVIEDALRRAELQGRSMPPQSTTRPAVTATAAAVVQRPVLAPSTGKSVHPAPPSPIARRIETTTEKSSPPNAHDGKPIVVAAPPVRYTKTILIAAIASLVFGHLILETIAEYPPLPSIIVAGDFDAPTTSPTPNSIALESMISDSSTTDSLASESLTTTFGDAALRAPATIPPVPVDTTNAPPPAPIHDHAAAAARPTVDHAAQSATNAALIESINQRFQVAGVMVSAGKRLVVINDVVVGLGGRVDGATVRAIDARGAVIEVDGLKHHLPVSARGRSESTARPAKN